jgi:hypothetical protein
MSSVVAHCFGQRAVSDRGTQLWTLAWSLLGPEREAHQVQRISDEAGYRMQP